jgi:cellobiose phosphorylase
MSIDEAEREVSRIELVQAVGAAFGSRGASRDDLLAAASEAGARREVLDLLRALRAREFNDVRQLWSELPEMPVH